VPGPRLPGFSVVVPPLISLGTGEEGNLGFGCSGSLTFTSSTVSIQWLVPLVACFGLDGGGGNGFEPTTPCPGLREEEGCVALAANFSFLAFCIQSGQVTSLAFAD
jgi:hypothetical protein